MLSSLERERFATQGWLVVRDAVAAADVERATRALDGIVPETTNAHGYRGKVVEISSISRGSPELARRAVDPVLGRLAADALGVRRVQLLQDSALVKAPGGGPVEWHRDASYLGYLDRPAVVTARLSLTPCTLLSGCLVVLDESHGWSAPAADLSFRRTSVEDTLAALPAELRAGGVETALELGAGDVSLHHCLTFHASAVNRGTRPRKTLVFRFVDADCRLVPERLPSPELLAHFPVDDSGHLSTARFPVVYERPA
jgi:ectoine hydroxylase-related dioxygenase (phytanoyl-CoA dioxygenase family)